MSSVAGAPLGVFDSGLGGLTVVRALRRELPSEHIAYLGDTARIPYGTRAPSTVVRYAEGCSELLMGLGVKAVVVACNTASAVALEALRERLDVPVIGVVEPGASAAVGAARALTGPGPPRIGVLGTEGTIRSGAYSRAVQKIAPDLEVSGQAAPLLVPLAEEGWVTGEVPELAAERYLQPLMDRGARVVVLGCTHYPLLRDVLRETANRLCDAPVAIVDSADATASAVAQLLTRRGLVAPDDRVGRLRLLVTDLPDTLPPVARNFLGAALPEIEQVDINVRLASH